MMWQATHPSLLWGAAALPVVWWSLRGVRSALPGWRFTGVAVTRHLLLMTLVLGLAGLGSVREIAREPVVVYLVDRSHSMDAQETLWQQQLLARLEGGLSERAERILLAFAGQGRALGHWAAHQALDARALQSATTEGLVDIQPEATNLQHGLLSSFSAAPTERARRVVLLSDGLPTTGQALQAAQVARLEHVPIFPFQPPSSGHDDVAITKLLVPQVAQRGAPTAVRVGVDNASRQAVRSRLVVRGNDERVLFDQRFELPPGRHLVEAPVRPETLGRFLVTARVDAEGDGLAANNARQAAFEVVGPPRVLLLSRSRSDTPYVAQVLQARQIEVETSDVSGLPAELSQLLTYDAVILSNLPRSALNAEQMTLLKRYVQEFGGGLVVIGSGGDLAAEATARTALDEILPARLTLNAPQERQAQARLSLILLVDRSSSMTGQRLTLTKHGAVELVKQLQPTDMLGVTAFDTRPFVVVPLQPVGMSRANIVDRLVKLTSGGGTHFLPALVFAKTELNNSGAKVKHLLLLSDGNTMDPNSPFYQQFAQEARAEGVTVSTLAMGTMFVNTELMEFLARATGGTFYQVRDERELPQLIVSDTQRLLERSPFAEGAFRLALYEPHESLRGVSAGELPQVKGYLVMEAKPEATTSLVISSDERERDPLLVHWQAGLGRVTTFASDAESRWSSPWLQWDQYQKFWSQVLTWTMRRSSLRELMVRTATVGASPMLIVHTPPATQTVEQFVVRLMPLDESATSELALSRVSPTQWHTSLEGVPPGLYAAVFLQTAHGQLIGETRRWVDVSSASFGLAQETAAAPPDVELLRALAERSGGALDAEPETIIGQHPTQRVVDSWDGWLIPLFLALLLLDVALRGETML